MVSKESIKDNRTGQPALTRWVLFAAAIAAIQYAPGARFDETREQISGGAPMATLVLLLCTVTALMITRGRNWPTPRWSHVLTFGVLSIGLCGLHSSELKSGIKELVQLGEVFGLSWLLFRLIPRDQHSNLYRGLGILGLSTLLIGTFQLYRFPPFYLSEARWAGLVVISFPFALYLVRNRIKCLISVEIVATVILGYFLKNGGLLLTWALVNTATILLLNRKHLSVAIPASITALIIASAVPGPSAFSTLMPMYDALHPRRSFVEYTAAVQAPKYYPCGGGLGQYKRTINQLKLRNDLEPSPAENKIPRDSNSQYLLTMVESGLPGALMLLLLLTIPGGMLAYRSGASLGQAKQGIAVLSCALIGAAFAGLFTTILGRGIGIWIGGLLALSESYFKLPESSRYRFIGRFAVPGGIAFSALLIAQQFNTAEPDAQHISGWNRMISGAKPPSTPAPPLPVPMESVAKSDTGLQIFQLDDEEDEKTFVKVLTFEGENFYKAESPIQRCKANNASGNQALEIPDKSGNAKGAAYYKADIPAAGRYTLSARAWWKDGCSNSIRFVIQGQQVKITDELFKRWHDLRGLRTFDLPAGPIEIQVQNVEDGIMLDTFQLSPSE